MSDIINEAKKYWENGFNCSQAAACGILDYYGYEQQSDVLKKALLPFGGGIGERSICGSLTGALAGLSSILHERGIEKDTIYKMTKKLKERFKEEIGTLYCKEILLEFTLPDGSIEFNTPGRRKTCDNTVFQAVSIVKEIIDAL